MEISIIEKFKKVKNEEMHVYSSSDRFKEWHQLYIQNLSTKQEVKIDSFYYTQSIKEIINEQKQFLSSSHGQQIRNLRFQFNNWKLSSADEANIKFLLQQLTKLQSIIFSSIPSLIYKTIFQILMELGLVHLSNIKILKFQNGFISAAYYHKFLLTLAHLEELELCIHNNEEEESNIITDSLNLSNLISYKLSFGDSVEQQQQQVNSQVHNNVQQQNPRIQRSDSHSLPIIDVLLNQVMEMERLKQLTLNVSGKLLNNDAFLLLNNCLSHKNQLEDLSLDLSYHKSEYNLQQIFVMYPSIKKLSINCNSSLKFKFEDLICCSNGDSYNTKNTTIKQQKTNTLNNITNHDDRKANNQNEKCQLEINSNHEHIKVIGINNIEGVRSVKQNIFEYTQLEKLTLKLNFTNSTFVNSIFNFLISQRPLIKSLKKLHLEVSFVYPQFCTQRVGQFLSKLQNLDDLFFQCHYETNENTRDSIYLLRQIAKIKSLKTLVFNMKVITMDNDYCELIQYFTKQCYKLDINIFKGLGLIKIGDKSQHLAVYTILNEQQQQQLYSTEELKQNPVILSYIQNCIKNSKQITQAYLQLVHIPNQPQQQITSFISSFENFKQLKELSISFQKFNIPEIKYALSELTKIIPKLKLLKALWVQNRNFQQSNFKNEYENLLIASISSNLYLKSINLENYSNQTYDDYQLLYLQNLLNVKYKIARSIIPQILFIKNKWPVGWRKQIYIDVIQQFYN